MHCPSSQPAERRPIDQSPPPRNPRHALLTTFCSAVTGYIDNETPTPPQLITGLATGNNGPYTEQPRLSVLRRINAAANPGGLNASQDEVMEAGMAEATTLDSAIKLVEDALVARIAKAISMSPEDIDVDLPLYTYGVDSLIAVEIRNWTMTRLKSEVSIFDILSPMPIKDLAGKMATGSKLVRPEARQQEGDKSDGCPESDKQGAAHVEAPEEKNIKEAVKASVQGVNALAPPRVHGLVTYQEKVANDAVRRPTTTLKEVVLTSAAESPPPSYNAVVSSMAEGRSVGLIGNR